MTKQKDKKLLSEATTRRWMQLAKIDNLSDKFIKENYEEEGVHKEEETVQRASEGAKLSQTPVKQGGNKTMAQESVKKEEEGMHREEENLQEVMPEEQPPEAPVGEPPVDTGHHEPDGDEAAGEPMVADLVKAIADAITQATGVSVDVQGGGGEGEEMGGAEPPMPPPGPGGEGGPEKEMEERKGHRDHGGTHYDHDGEPMGEGKTKLKEDFSEAPKVTKQNVSAQGSVKDPYKSQVKVQGVEKPESMGSNHYPHKMKALEEQVVKNVLRRMLEEIKKTKTAPKK